MLAALVDAKELQRQDLIKNISSYRPSATIFEQGKSMTDANLLMMSEKRKNHTKVIQKQAMAVALATPDLSSSKRPAKMTLEQSNAEELASTFSTVIAPGKNKAKLMADAGAEAEAKLVHATGDTRVGKVVGAIDMLGTQNLTTQESAKPKEFKVSSRPKDEYTDKHLSVSGSFATKANSVAFDINGDDNKTIQSNRQREVWDRKKKKFIREGSEFDAPKRIKTESGNYIKASYKGDKYSEWREKHNVDRAITDKEGKPTFSNGRKGRFNNSKPSPASVGGGTSGGGAKGQKRGGAATKGGELLSRDQIVKNRKKEAKLRANTVPGKRKKGQPRKVGGNSSKNYSKGKGLGGAGKKHKR